MALVANSKKSCSVNPLKMSRPMGGALAFLGLANCMPVLHGSQGCTAFGLVLLVRHFREAIPLQTTAMNEMSTILGGMENLEQALVNIHQRAKPDIIGVCSTGLTETRGDDMHGDLRLIRKRHPELQNLPIVLVNTADFKGAFQDGWGKAVFRIIEELVPLAAPPFFSTAAKGAEHRVNLLPGCHLTAADIEEIVEMLDAFGIKATVLPDLSGSLDGHILDQFSPTTLGGTTVEQIRCMGHAQSTIAIGAQMTRAAQELEKRSGVKSTVFDRLTGLEANDLFLSHLSELSGVPVPHKYRRQRSQLVDAMLDGHFFFGGKKIALGAEPDLLWALGSFLVEMGCVLEAAVTTTSSVLLERMPCAKVLIGDLADLEELACGCDLLISHSHGRMAAERLGIPLFRAGLPCFDRLGANHKLSVGYRGTRDLIFQIGNLFLEHCPENTPDSWPLAEVEHAAQTRTM